jgi:molecular chaperone DnaK (HSP70)
MANILDCLNDVEAENEVDAYFGNVKTKNEEDKKGDDDKVIIGCDDQEEIIVGIDLGTTNSCVGIWRNKNLEIIPDQYGNRTIPSVVAFGKRSKFVGREAKNQSEINPENCFYEVKRLIGRKLKDETVQNDLEFLTYGLAEDEEGNVLLKTDGSSMKDFYTPEEISAMVLTKLKGMAEDYLKRPVTKAVITVPAYFTDSQREATKDAAKIASLNLVRIINEPTAAALAYGLEKSSAYKGDDMNVLVYDIGGGTTDVSILNICDGMFHVLSSSGNTHLGGSDFDSRLVSYSLNYFKKKHGIAKLENLSVLSMQRLRKSCEHVKKMLSQTSKDAIAVKDFHDGINLYIPITRKDFEKICRELFIICLKPVEDALTSAGLEKDDIDELILVGGATRIPLIRENIRLFFNGKEPNANINPDEVVAAGAAIQGYILANNKDPFSENVVLLDVIPLSLGVETIGGVMTTLISRNSVIPINRKEKFTTDKDFETTVNVKIFEGERKMTKDNFFVGEFILKGLQKAPRGIPQIEVSFNVDINGIISVSAEDLKNPENKNSIIISGNKGRLSEEEIEKLVVEAIEMETKDRLEREKKQLYYQIDDLCSNIAINVKNPDFKIKEADMRQVSEDIEKVYEWLKEKSYIERSHKDYDKILKRMSEKYGVLIMKTNNGDNKVKAVGDASKTEGTTVYNDEEDEQEVYESIEQDEFGFTDETEEEEREQIKQLRTILYDLCDTVITCLSSSSVNMAKEHVKEITDYINDATLWIHVAEKVKKIEYMQKIDEINRVCDDIVSKYGDDMLFNNISTETELKKEELSQLCYATMACINSNVFSLHEEKIVELKKYIEDQLDWLIEIEINKRKAEIEETEYISPTIDEINERVNQLNSICDQLYNSMVGYDSQIVIDDLLIGTDSSCVSSSGTTIQSIRERVQK